MQAMAFVRLEADQTIEHTRGGDAAKELSFTLSGSDTPIVSLLLEPDQAIICEPSVVMQMTAGIECRPWPDLSASARLMINNQDGEQASVTLMARCNGRVGVFDLAKHGGRLLCPRLALLAAGPGVMVTIYSHFRSIGTAGLDLLQLEGNGLAFLRACGDVEEIKLLAGEQAHINAAALAAMSATVDFGLPAPDSNQGLTGFAVLTGPGNVWLQSGDAS